MANTLERFVVPDTQDTTPENVCRALAHIDEFFDAPEKWHKGSFGLSPDGHSLGDMIEDRAQLETASCLCLDGAMRLVCNYRPGDSSSSHTPLYWELDKVLTPHVASQVARPAGFGGTSIPELNDAPETTFSHIKAAIQSAKMANCVLSSTPVEGGHVITGLEKLFEGH